MAPTAAEARLKTSMTLLHVMRLEQAFNFRQPRRSSPKAYSPSQRGSYPGERSAFCLRMANFALYHGVAPNSGGTARFSGRRPFHRGSGRTTELPPGPGSARSLRSRSICFRTAETNERCVEEGHVPTLPQLISPRYWQMGRSLQMSYWATRVTCRVRRRNS